MLNHTHRAKTICVNYRIQVFNVLFLLRCMLQSFHNKLRLSKNTYSLAQNPWAVTPYSYSRLINSHFNKPQMYPNVRGSVTTLRNMAQERKVECVCSGRTSRARLILGRLPMPWIWCLRHLRHLPSCFQYI